MYTTLNKIRAHGPCTSGWSKLLKNLGKTGADDEPLAIATILESNGLDDALWCLRAVDGHDDAKRFFAVDCARMVQHLMTDKRSIDALDVAERHASGLATSNDLERAWAASRAVAGDASWAASWAASRAAAGDASWAVAGAVARAVARAVAGDEMREAQSNLLALYCAMVESEEGGS